jgi:hypothetical protein
VLTTTTTRVVLALSVLALLCAAGLGEHDVPWCKPGDPIVCVPKANPLIQTRWKVVSFWDESYDYDYHEDPEVVEDTIKFWMWTFSDGGIDQCVLAPAFSFSFDDVGPKQVNLLVNDDNLNQSADHRNDPPGTCPRWIIITAVGMSVSHTDVVEDDEWAYFTNIIHVFDTLYGTPQQGLRVGQWWYLWHWNDQVGEWECYLDGEDLLNGPTDITDWQGNVYDACKNPLGCNPCGKKAWLVKDPGVLVKYWNPYPYDHPTFDPELGPGT